MGCNVRKASRFYIEISGSCQAKCPYCVQKRLKQSNKFGGIMSPTLFEKILDHLIRIEIIDKSVVDSICLFNWGEPFLNSNINNILRILKEKQLYADISSNFIARPNIDKKYISVIKSINFSLSGFSQDTYGRIHGAVLENVLNNFNDLYVLIKKYSPKTVINVSWHRYVFNENEFWSAYKYFNKIDVDFAPVTAFLNDLLEMIESIEGELPESRKNQVEKDIFLRHIVKTVAYHKQKSKNFHCPAWDHVVIDEIGQLLTCCGVTRYDSDHVLGNILEMSAKEIWESKTSDPLCNKCIASGIARWGSSPDIDSHHMSWPSGGGLHCLKLWGRRNLSKNSLGRIVRNLPCGEEVFRFVKKIKRFIVSFE